MIATDKLFRRLSQAVLLLLTAIVLLTFQHYGVSWDEEIQSQYGQAIVDYYFSGFVDHRYDEIFNLYLYGGMFDGLASLIDRYSPLGIYPARHLLNAFFGLLGLWGTCRLARLFGGNAVGLVALVLLALTPSYYGHMFNNPKDIPFAAGIIWSLYYMAKTLRLYPKVPTKLVLTLGLVYGLTLGVRVGGAMLFAFWSLVLLAQSRDWRAIKLILPVGAIAYGVMLICWPWAQQSPIWNPLRALSEFSNFPQNVEVMLDGTTYMSTQLPWTYVPLYFGVQLPLMLLALLGLSILLMPKIFSNLKQNREIYAFILMILMGTFPILYALIHHPALYDAVRHFTFALQIFCVLAGLAAQQIWQRLPLQKPLVAISAITALSVMTVLHISTMVQLHPYEYIYVNPLQGDVAGAYGKYELDYWGSSFKEAAEELQDYLAKEGGVPAGKIYRVAICGPWSAAMNYLPPDYEAVVANEPAEFFLSTTRWGCQNMRPGKEIITIERMGAPLSVIKDLR